VYINVSLLLMLEKEVSPTEVATEAEKQIRSYVSSLGIGEDVLFSRIIESALDIRGAWDVKGVKISAHSVEGEIVESERENIEISSEERAEPRTINISFETRK
jgi:hypothetical protein